MTSGHWFCIYLNQSGLYSLKSFSFYSVECSCSDFIFFVGNSADAGTLVDSYVSGKIIQLKEQIATLEKREERSAALEIA